MIINHNMNAMNAHRMMTGNTSTAGKSMEKLSSGLRINRAGDDAAGLAISEKMRGQIRGLDQASRNSQDAISMIQTAEGALNETHSILQRMKELSTQGANGTNTETDRDAIQKEFNQLTSEINRIGNTTEFNTKKLLQGSTNASNVGATASAGTSAVDSVAAVKAVFDTGDITALTNGETGTISFMGATISLTATNDATALDQSTLTGVTGTAATVALDTDASGADTQAEQATKIVAAFDAMKAVSGSPLADFTFAVSGNKVVITGSAAAGATNNTQLISTTGDMTITNTTNTAQNTTPGVTAVAGVAQSNDLTFSSVPTEGSTVSVAGKNVAFYDSSKTTFSSAADAATKLGATSASYVIDIAGKGTSDIASEVAALDFSNTGSGATASASGNKVTFTSETAGTSAASQATITTKDAYEGSKSVLTAGTAADADTTGDAFQMNIVVGSKSFTVDETALQANFADLDTYGSADQTTVIDALKNAVAADGTKLSDVADISFVNGTNQNLKIEAKEVGTDNITINVTGADAATADIKTALGLTSEQTEGTAGTAAFTNGGQDFEESFQVGANQGQSFNISVKDMRSQALQVSGTAAGADNASVAGAKYLATKGVTNGTDSTNTEYALDVSSSSDAASAAIKVVENAINTVSSERAKLGSYQNRLEHTIANLGTSSENLTSAESRIRDVDMAKEMMTFSKNNILSQAAQAMLAQANQQPQGVLQLLR